MSGNISIPDGELGEWRDATFHRLRGTPSAEASFASDSNTLRIAVRVRATDVSARSGANIGEGTHVALTVMHDDSSERFSPRDLVLLIAPNDGSDSVTAFVGSMKFEGFMAKWLAKCSRNTKSTTSQTASIT